ncbi:hypothetical protein [Roseovarius pacificus]|uniref:hypothetical protein n=1 Tax=Roseovarius pacificus TaxID=337701 RepID=UPI002A18D740|nr:hypothetical protein [Roseovarius pacificus]
MGYDVVCKPEFWYFRKAEHKKPRHEGRGKTFGDAPQKGSNAERKNRRGASEGFPHRAVIVQRDGEKHYR